MLDVHPPPLPKSQIVDPSRFCSVRRSFRSLLLDGAAFHRSWLWPGPSGHGLEADTAKEPDSIFCRDAACRIGMPPTRAAHQEAGFSRRGGVGAPSAEPHNESLGYEGDIAQITDNFGWTNHMESYSFWYSDDLPAVESGSVIRSANLYNEKSSKPHLKH
jgi:hypothetical protein